MFQVCFNKYRGQMEAYLTDKKSRTILEFSPRILRLNILSGWSRLDLSRNPTCLLLRKEKLLDTATSIQVQKHRQIFRMSVSVPLIFGVIIVHDFVFDFGLFKGQMEDQR